MGERPRSKEKKLRKGGKAKPAAMQAMPRRPGGKRIEPYIRWALQVCSIVVEEYLAKSRRPNAKKRSADDLHSIIKKIYKRTGNGEIRVEYLARDKSYKNGDFFLGLILRKKKVGPRIYLNPKQSKPSQRLALVQESFQALLDHKRLRSKGLGTDLGAFIEFRRLRVFENATGPTFGELIAEIAAMQALFPYRDRQLIHVRNMSKPPSKSLIIKLAREYGIPARWVRFYLRDTIMNQLSQFNRH